MPCERTTKNGQTIQQRAESIRKAVSALDLLIMKKRVRVVVGKQGAVSFLGEEWEKIRDGISDNCAYRRILVHGSVLARMEITRAEELAGTKVNRQVVAQGVHSHDGGATWHGKG
jgi:hypothetical protein